MGTAPRHKDDGQRGMRLPKGSCSKLAVVSCGAILLCVSVWCCTVLAHAAPMVDGKACLSVGLLSQASKGGFPVTHSPPPLSSIYSSRTINMVGRLDKVFQTVKDSNKACFVAYLTAGFPDPSETVGLMMALQRGGCNVIELGVPFTDPQADGGTIQRANQVACPLAPTSRRAPSSGKQGQDTGSRVFNWGRRGSIEPPQNLGEGGAREKGSIDRTINQLL